jgi:hypothetical protein
VPRKAKSSAPGVDVVALISTRRVTTAFILLLVIAVAALEAQRVALLGATLAGRPPSRLAIDHPGNPVKGLAEVPSEEEGRPLTPKLGVVSCSGV